MDPIALLNYLNVIAKAIFTLGDAFAGILHLVCSMCGLTLPLNLFRVVTIVAAILITWFSWEKVSKWVLILIIFAALSSIIGVLGGTFFGG